MPTKPKGLFEEVDAELGAPRKKRLRALKIKLILFVIAMFGMIVAGAFFGAYLAS